MEAAYDENAHFLSNEYCSFKGDLWDAVLVETGYNIMELRRKYSIPRKPWYTDGYSRQDFERLWHGMESRCPDWDDPPIWPPDCPQDPAMIHEHREGENSILTVLRIVQEMSEDS